ncbi:MAG: hypothetical protein D3909_16895 [Candidatus Electrothrix sp. ATG1]|nr:hypothetical protein [Candidatus Electrothrix sp. ATG1]MCI5211427.1 hypothetical protein [Candidatus Electrothrix sp. ATG2]
MTKKPACECCDRQAEEIEVFEANITHNLNTMADKAGIYYHVWRPEEIGIKKAGDLIFPLEKGISDMKARPGFYKKFDAPNGWGTYDEFVPWLEEYLQACKNYPEAEIGISR